MKILFSDNSLHGQLNFRGEVLKSYISRGDEVVLVSPPDREYNWSNNKVKYIPIELSRSSMSLLHDLKYFLQLYEIYKREKVDYIFHYSIKPNIYGSLAAKLLGIPSTAMITGLGYVFYQKGLKCTIARGLYKFALQFPEYIFLLNANNKKLLEKGGFVKTEKVIFLTGGEGVDLNRFIPLKKEPEVNPRIVFLMISRPLYDKGYVEYVEAARQIKRTYKNVEFQLLGPIDTVYPRHIPEKQVWEDHESRTINYLGFVKNVIPIIKECDCIVLPSYNEGLSRSLMEAIAMGKPVITTNIPGCKETVEEGMNGYLVTPKSVESLVTAFNKFMNLTPRQRHMMGEYSREKAEREFDIKKVIEVYKSITDTLR